ncbi:hypothetical protein EYF80_060439 [Liparis tanakae]|uniref:Uncharacterized protein n=1 Tax=Liparis tanakae TaxID=230148 RepID=A0A4Z2EKR1_9TELE|nr:hypothetical protein EYF80_060439 [Liparis tanakae]
MEVNQRRAAPRPHLKTPGPLGPDAVFLDVGEDLQGKALLLPGLLAPLVGVHLGVGQSLFSETWRDTTGLMKELDDMHRHAEKEEDTWNVQPLTFTSALAELSQQFQL